MSITLDGSTGISVSGNNNLSIGTLAAGNTTITGTLAANATTITGNVSVTGTQFVNGAVTIANSTSNTITLSSNGYVGIYNTPNPYWNAGSTSYGYKVLNVGRDASFTGWSSDARVYAGMLCNLYLDGTSTYKYQGTGFASSYRQFQGTHEWTIAANGTANSTANSITVMYINSNYDITFANGTSNVMFLAANGQVGINTNSPSKLSGVKSLTIDSTGSNYSGVELSVANTKTFDLLASNSASYISTRTNTPIIFQTNDADKGRITGAGDVLINTANSTAGGFIHKLVAKQSNAYWYGGIGVEASSNDHVLTMGCDATSTSLTSSYRTSSGYRPLILRAGGYDAINIDTSGRVQMPYQICVQCGAAAATYTSGATYKHWGQSGYVFQNQGSAWNASTGVFTSPISATYMVIAKVRFSVENYSSSGNYNYMQFVNTNTSVNGTPIFLWSPAAYTGGTYRPYVLTAIMKLNTNDTITPGLYIYGGGSVTSDGGTSGQTDDQLSIIQIG